MSLLKKARLPVLTALIILAVGCHEVHVPKPVGYFRIDLPGKEYTWFNNKREEHSDLPFKFQYPVYGQLSFQNGDVKEPGFFNIEFPSYKARIYLTYKNIDNNFESLMEQNYRMNVKNHIMKADAIREEIINDPGKKVYGILYDLRGNTASAVQFYLTDSIRHYLRGSLYFSAEPDADSLEPVITFFRSDIVHLIETLEWEN